MAIVKDFIKSLLLTALLYFAPTKHLIITISVLCGLDLISGIAAAIKQKIPVTSNELKRTVLKGLLYQGAILIAFMVQKELTSSDVPVMNWVSTMIGLVELKSILENLDIISGGSLFTSLTDKLQNYLNNNR